MITTILHNYHISFINYEKAIQCLFLRNTVASSSLVASFYYLNVAKQRRARRAPNKHYEIPFVRGMPCSSLYTIQLLTPQAT